MIETPPDGAVPRGRVGVASRGDPAIDLADGERINAPTIYDVARLAGVSRWCQPRYRSRSKTPAHTTRRVSERDTVSASCWHVVWQKPEGGVAGEGPDHPEVAPVERRDDVRSVFPGENSIHGIRQPDRGIITKQRVCGGEARADRGNLPSAGGNAAVDVAQGRTRRVRAASAGDEIIKLGQHAR